MSVERLSVASAAEKISGYLSRDTLRPYFVIADDATMAEAFKKCFNGFEQIDVSNFFVGDDLLDADRLVDRLNAVENGAFVFGLGEYIYRTGRENILRALQDRNFNGKIIFVCRGIANILERLADNDRKFRANNICRLEGKFEGNFMPVVEIPRHDANGGAKPPTRKTDAAFEFLEDDGSKR